MQTHILHFPKQKIKIEIPYANSMEGFFMVQKAFSDLVTAVTILGVSYLCTWVWQS